MSVRRRFGCEDCEKEALEFREVNDPPDCLGCGKKMEFWFSAPNFARDLENQEGRYADRIPMPAFGPGVTVGSRRELKELQKRLPETLYNRTEGDHETFKVDPTTGKKEKVTIRSQGIELGEVRTSEGKERPDLHKLAVDTAKAEFKADVAAGKVRFPG
jgi:hypothetical protein